MVCTKLTQLLLQCHKRASDNEIGCDVDAGNSVKSMQTAALFYTRLYPSDATNVTMIKKIYSFSGVCI